MGFLSRESESDIVTGEYGDNSDRDERYWAAAQMWRATGEVKYLTAVESIGVQSGMDSANLGDYGNIAILTMDGIDKDSDVYRKAKNAILRSADTTVTMMLESKSSVLSTVKLEKK